MFTLQQYILHKGAAKVAEELGITDVSVSQWLHKKSAPRPHTAFKLIQITNNLLSWESIYLPYVAHNNEAQIENDFGGKA